MVQATKCSLHDEQHLSQDGRRIPHLLETLGRIGAEPGGGKRKSLTSAGVGFSSSLAPLALFPRSGILFPLMTKPWLVLSIVVGLVFMLAAPAWANYRAGLDAIKSGDYDTALKEFRPLAMQGDALNIKAL